jgi:hypothetical protein
MWFKKGRSSPGRTDEAQAGKSNIVMPQGRGKGERDLLCSGLLRN